MSEELNAGRELDALIAEKVMGGFVEGDPEAWSGKAETWFWIHPQDGVLIGDAYHANILREDNEPMLYSHSWKRFKPSTDISDAWLVVEAMESKGLWFRMGNVIPNSDPIVYEVEIGNAYACEDTAPLAICKAALQAVDIADIDDELRERKP